jgi:hypothetical protein
MIPAVIGKSPFEPIADLDADAGRLSQQQRAVVTPFHSDPVGATRMASPRRILSEVEISTTILVLSKRPEPRVKRLPAAMSAFRQVRGVPHQCRHSWPPLLRQTTACTAAPPRRRREVNAPDASKLDFRTVSAPSLALKYCYDQRSRKFPDRVAGLHRLIALLPFDRNPVLGSFELRLQGQVSFDFRFG